MNKTKGLEPWVSHGPTLKRAIVVLNLTGMLLLPGSSLFATAPVSAELKYKNWVRAAIQTNVKGKVTDKTGTPLPGATVRVKG